MPDIIGGFRAVTTVISDGRSGEDFLRSLFLRDIDVGSYARRMLSGEKFIPTEGVTYNLVVGGGRDETRTLLPPTMEAAALFRAAVSDKELLALGVDFVVIMHEPVEFSGGAKMRLCIPLDSKNRLIGWHSGTAPGREAYIYLLG